eukprot:CAMPEP_0206419568 /NCGR_PEP_ID=MMETSP0324_2-20121206/224_1 /ASSEMBLY_ACC=CAM_ASM_000836 /TAXON_ID=2866 /ORGANISM="Crypthecodinium cohnii, Strain Seligo" /LENGTH=58 /DNA_ID=CAMNT_0053883085 /DNA_START=182 /DNA_END=359 /DNA_ORIENTATION=+
MAPLPPGQLDDDRQTQQKRIPRTYCSQLLGGVAPMLECLLMIQACEWGALATPIEDEG